MIRPSHPTRGVAHVTNARWDAMDATASGAQWQSQGEMNLVSDMRRADGRRFKTVSMKTGRIGTRSGESFGGTGADGEVV